MGDDKSDPLQVHLPKKSIPHCKYNPSAKSIQRVTETVGGTASGHIIPKRGGKKIMRLHEMRIASSLGETLALDDLKHFM